MAAKRWYPLFLDIEGKLVLVVGGGKVAFRKAAGAAAAGAHVRMVSPRFLREFEAFEGLERIQREFKETDVEGATLVFAATDSREVNRRVGEAACALGISANIADAPGECAFIVPARIHRKGLQVAISTGGADPKLAAELRKKMEEFLDQQCWRHLS
jgi:siroheme synthase-like protein